MNQAATAGSSTIPLAPGIVRPAPRALFALKLALLAIATLLAMWYRRPDQFAIPGVWVEDGAVAIPDYVRHGWLSVFYPIQGYFSVPIRFLHALAETLSFRWLPEIGLWLGVGFSFAVLAMIATAPTTLRLPFVCAALTLVIPCDSEVFAVSLYTGWWGSLLLLPPLLWRDDGKPRSTLRLSLIAIGGLSSPLVLGIAPLYALRALVRRTRMEFVALGVCAATAILQFMALRQLGPVGRGTPALNLPVVLEKFFGYFVVQSGTPGLAGWLPTIGLALAVFIAAAWLRHRRELGLAFVLLGGALGCAIIASMTRIPVEVIHPKIAGPRYFFYPFVLLTWLVVQLASIRGSATGYVATIILAFAARNGLEVAQRRHEAIDWRAHVAQCIASPAYAFPIHFAGELKFTWSLQLTGEQCRQLVRQSLFDNQLPQ